MAYASDIDIAQTLALDTPSLEGVRTARVVAWLIDYALIGVATGIVSFMLVVLTLGLGWGLLPIVFPAIALAYLALTLGGEAQATWGMRMTGVRIFKLEATPENGARVDPFLAMLHGVLFWFLGWWSLPTTFLSSRKRLLHDIVLGTWVGKV